MWCVIPFLWRSSLAGSRFAPSTGQVQAFIAENFLDEKCAEVPLCDGGNLWDIWIIYQPDWNSMSFQISVSFFSSMFISVLSNWNVKAHTLTDAIRPYEVNPQSARWAEVDRGSLGESLIWTMLSSHHFTGKTTIPTFGHETWSWRWPVKSCANKNQMM